MQTIQIVRIVEAQWISMDMTMMAIFPPERDTGSVVVVDFKLEKMNCKIKKEYRDLQLLQVSDYQVMEAAERDEAIYGPFDSVAELMEALDA